MLAKTISFIVQTECSLSLVLTVTFSMRAPSFIAVVNTHPFNEISLGDTCTTQKSDQIDWSESFFLLFSNCELKTNVEVVTYRL